MLTLLLSTLAVVLALAPAAPPDCEALYFGEDRPRDLPGALACFRASEDWTMVTIMLLNGEGARADLKGARAAYESLLKAQGGQPDADGEALGQILRKREANPRAAGRIDFCRDIAQTTLSMNGCPAREDRADDRRTRTLVAKVRTVLAPAQQAQFDEVAAAAARVIEADGQRVYQQFIDGSIRNVAALSQQTLVRKNYRQRVEAWLINRSVPAGGRSFAETDRELNAVYKAEVASADDEYRKKARDAQRAWVRYRDAFARLVSGLRTGSSVEVEQAVRSAITEDRITELKSNPVGGP
jgi:uncharacterized protein YecT (DUF1311 family)